MDGHGGFLKAVWKWAALALWAAGFSAWADGGAAARAPDLAGSKAAMFNYWDSGEGDALRPPFYACDMGLMFVAKAPDKAAPDVAALKAKLVDMCAIELGAYRSKGPMYQTPQLAFASADYFARQDWAQANHAEVLRMVEEYKAAKSFWSYATFSLGHYDPAKGAFPLSFGGACPTFSALTGSGSSPSFMAMCWEAQAVDAQLPPDRARRFEQSVSNPHFYLMGRVYWEPAIVKEGLGPNGWKLRAKVVGAEVFFTDPAGGPGGLPKKGIRALGLGSIPQ
jgi:hypothetical protein